MLLGILALQRGHIRERDLIAALHAWALVPHRALGELLLERRALTPAQHEEILRLAQGRGDISAATSAPAAAPPAGPSRYKPRRLHAKGGLGEVHVALDAELDREVALKQIQGHLADDPSCRARFLREARVTARLEHPGVVPVLGLGSHPDGRPFYAMRLVDGETMREAIRRFHFAGAPTGEPALASRELLARFVAVCHTMAYAHSRGVIHRDLKPSNVLLGRFGETLVVDWGLAKVSVEADESLCDAAGELLLTARGEALGTPGYMPPEQARGESVDERADVYALGGILYEVLTGQPPHPNGDPARPPRPPRMIEPCVPEALEAIAMRALRPAREDRPQSAAELAAMVERWLAGPTDSAWNGDVTPPSLLAPAEASDMLFGSFAEDDHSRGPAWPPEPTSANEATPSRYTLWQELAHGGTGVLYLCHDEDLNRLVVVKELRPDLAANAHARRWFLREAQVTAQLEHPGIRGVHGLGRHPDGRPFLVLRYVRGRDLRQAIREFHERQSTLPSCGDPELLAMLQAVAQVAKALAYAHERGVVHGDPKPGNVLLGAAGEVLLSDWGLARLVPTGRLERVMLSEWAEPAASPDGSALGTPEYMAPETAAGEPSRIGPAADVFALGATLFHVLAGKPRTETPSPLVDAAPWVPAKLAAIAEKAMSPARERRYEDAARLAAELERWLRQGTREMRAARR